MNTLKYLYTSLFTYTHRKLYAIQRRIIPSVKERHRLESMIGPLGYWEQIQKYHFNFLMQMGLKPHHTFLDVGCGPLPTGLVVIPYLERGNYVGIDIKQESIAEGYRQLFKAGLAGKNPLLLVSDSFGRNELNRQTFDYILASQIVYHFNAEKIKFFLEQISNRMHPGSKLYGDIIGYPNKVNSASHWHEFTFHLHTPEFLAGLGKNYGLKLTNLGKIEQYGYPASIDLKTNNMLEFKKNH